MSEGVSLAEARSQLGAGAIPPPLRCCHGPQHAAGAAGAAAAVGARATKNTGYLFARARNAHLPSLPHPPTAASLSPPAGRVVDTLPDKSTDRQTGDSDHATEKQKVKILTIRGKAGGL